MLMLGIVQTSLTSALAQPHLSSFLIFIDWVSSLTPLTSITSSLPKVEYIINMRHKVHHGFVPFWCLNKKSSLNVWWIRIKVVNLQPRECLVCFPCGVSMPCLMNKIEALCSFLQAENVGNFQSLQKSFEKARVPNGHTQIHEDGHSGFTHYCVELLNEHHLVYFGYFLRPSA